ncbi:hypothetical protein ACFQRB_20445, partial [Halobaculum litoreum]
MAAALGYNAVVTGDPFVFPYLAFAPEDGVGFGERAILGHEVDYTVDLALEANALVLETLFTDWVVAGAVGTAVAAGGVALALAGRTTRWRGRAHAPGSTRTARGDGRDGRGRQRRLLGQLQRPRGARRPDGRPDPLPRAVLPLRPDRPDGRLRGGGARDRGRHGVGRLRAAVASRGVDRRAVG